MRVSTGYGFPIIVHSAEHAAVCMALVIDLPPLDGNLEVLMDCMSLGLSTALVGCCTSFGVLFPFGLRTAGIVIIVVNSVGHGCYRLVRCVEEAMRKASRTYQRTSQW